MKGEYEIVKHSQIEDLNIFLVQMTYRSPHMHREFEICMVLSGVVTIYANSKSRSFKKGDLMIFNPRQTHEIHALTEKSLILSVQVASGFYKKIYPEISCIFFDDIAVEYPEEASEELLHLRKLFLRLSVTYLNKEKGYEFLCMGYLSEAFGILLRSQSWRLISEQEREERYTKGKRMNRIMDYVEEHYTERLLLSDIAQQEGLSVYYLSHFFKEMLGMSFQQYIALRRFERARKMLEHTDRSIAEICLECGFSDHRYLNKIYKKQLGYTPMEYRSSHMPRRTEQPEGSEETIGSVAQTFYSVEDSLKLLEIAEG